MFSLLYIGQTPAEGTGSPVIILRHLSRLSKAGWSITVIGEPGNDVSSCVKHGWSVLQLPLRRHWWPPFRANNRLLRTLRTWLLAFECKKLIRNADPDAILCYLAAHSDFSAEVASRFSKLRGIPLTMLVHDDASSFSPAKGSQEILRRRHSGIIARAHHCWFVSPELAEIYEAGRTRVGILPPIPAGWQTPASWTSSRTDSPRIYYAGFIWPTQYLLLAKISRIFHENGATLVLQTRDTPELRTFLAEHPVEWVPPFPTNSAALEHLAVTATALLVSYTETIEEMPWIATSYPSKFIEYSHLGLPCAIVAPTGSSIGRWATDRQYPRFFEPAATEALAEWCASLRDPAFWTADAGLMRNLAETEFSPERIQEQFARGLLA